MFQAFKDLYTNSYLVPLLLFLGPILFIFYFGYESSPTVLRSTGDQSEDEEDKQASSSKSKVNEGTKPSSLFGTKGGAKKPKLPPPKSDLYTPEELLKYDGSDEDLPILLAVKGVVFDVSGNRATYAPGGGYHMFVAKDASRALGISSLKLADCTDDLSGLTQQQLEVLDNWYKFFEERYPIVGKVSK